MGDCSEEPGQAALLATVSICRCSPRGSVGLKPPWRAERRPLGSSAVVSDRRQWSAAPGSRTRSLPNQTRMFIFLQEETTESEILNIPRLEWRRPAALLPHPGHQEDCSPGETGAHWPGWRGNSFLCFIFGHTVTSSHSTHNMPDMHDVNV